MNPVDVPYRVKAALKTIACWRPCETWHQQGEVYVA
jgi:hypothetical protein